MENLEENAPILGRQKTVHFLRSLKKTFLTGLKRIKCTVSWPISARNPCIFTLVKTMSKMRSNFWNPLLKPWEIKRLLVYKR